MKLEEAIKLLKEEPDYSLSYYKRENAIDIVLQEIERLNNIINELEKDMRERYHKEIDYQSKIMQSALAQGDYPVSYYYAEQNEKLLNYYLNKLKDLKELKGDSSNECKRKF